MVRRLSIEKNNHLTCYRLAINPRYPKGCSLTNETSLYEIHIMVIYSHAILVAEWSECRMKRVVCKTWTGANSADPDQTLQNAASDQGLHCLLKLQEVKG